MKSKVITAEAAAALVQDNDFLAIQGSGGGVSEPSTLIRAVRERFLADSAAQGADAVPFDRAGRSLRNRHRLSGATRSGQARHRRPPGHGAQDGGHDPRQRN